MTQFHLPLPCHSYLFRQGTGTGCMGRWAIQSTGNGAKLLYYWFSLSCPFKFNMLQLFSFFFFTLFLSSNRFKKPFKLNLLRYLVFNNSISSIRFLCRSEESRKTSPRSGKWAGIFSPSFPVRDIFRLAICINNFQSLLAARANKIKWNKTGMERDRKSVV